MIFKISSTINYRINNQITALELRVLDETGGHLGIMPREAALNLAREKGLDLIEIGAAAKPPVGQIIGFDKFRYQKEKEFRKQRFGQKKSGGMKQIRISSRAAQNDLTLKAELAEKFLQEDYRVEINLFLRGREKYNRDWAFARLNNFLKIIKIPYKITLEPRFTGRGFVAQIIKSVAEK